MVSQSSPDEIWREPFLSREVQRRSPNLRLQGRLQNRLPAFPTRQLLPNIPVVTGSEAIVQDLFDIRLTTPGSSISGTVTGYDKILCGNVKSSYYTLHR